MKIDEGREEGNARKQKTSEKKARTLSPIPSFSRPRQEDAASARSTASSASSERRPSASDGLTLREFVELNAARWDVPKFELEDFVKDYVAKLMRL